MEPAGERQRREKGMAAATSVVAAVFLTALKAVVGVATGSLGILAEAAHSALDLGAALLTLFAVRVSDRPADRDHPYGHGKVENLSALAETVLLLVTCVWIITEAVRRLVRGAVEVDPSLWAFLTMGISIVVDLSRVRVLERTLTRVTGRMEMRKDFAIVIPDDERVPRDIYLTPGEAQKARSGDKVVVELEPWEDEHLNPGGTIVEVLGPAGDARVEVLSVARSFGLPPAFPDAVERAAAGLPGTIPPDELPNRLDLRSSTCVTIDPEDAKDFDDAVAVTRIRKMTPNM